MDNFLTAISAVAPMAGYILIGMAARRRGLADEDLLDRMNAFVFRVLFPVMMFANVYRTDFRTAADIRLVLFVVGFTLLVIGLMVWLVPRFFIREDPATCGAFIQASFRGNLVALGIPLAASVYGADNIGAMSIICAFTVPVYNIVCVFLLEHFRPDGGSRPDLKELLRKVAHNPLILGAAAGAAYNLIIGQLLGIRTPGFFQKLVSDASSATSVIALIILGGSLRFSDLAGNGRYLAVSLALKLLLLPAAALSIAYMLGVRGTGMFCTLIAFGAPVSISSYSMSRSMGSNYRLSGQAIAFSTVLCVFTLFFWIVFLLDKGLM